MHGYCITKRAHGRRQAGRSFAWLSAVLECRHARRELRGEEFTSLLKVPKAATPTFSSYFCSIIDALYAITRPVRLVGAVRTCLCRRCRINDELQGLGLAGACARCAEPPLREE